MEKLNKQIKHLGEQSVRDSVMKKFDIIDKHHIVTRWYKESHWPYTDRLSLPAIASLRDSNAGHRKKASIQQSERLYHRRQPLQEGWDPKSSRSDRPCIRDVMRSAQDETLRSAVPAAWAGMGAINYTTAPKAFEPTDMPVDLSQQSVVIDGKNQQRGSHLSTPPGSLRCDVPFPEVKTCFDIFARGLKLSGNGPCLGSRTGPNREFVWMSYQEVIDLLGHFGSGLVKKGAAPGNDTRVGIYSANRPEWCISDYGCAAFSIVPVPIYDTLGPQACRHILNQCTMQYVVCDTQEKVETLLSLKSDVESLQTIIVVEEVSQEVKDKAKMLGVEVVLFYDIVELGKQFPQEQKHPKPDDLFSIVYTSGTTGNPKGAMLTHHNFLQAIRVILLQCRAAVDRSGLQGPEPNPEDVHLSYLPLAHNLERGMHVFLILNGARLGYFSGDVKNLTDDLMTLQPTIFPSVPRLLNRVYDAVQTELKKSKIKSMMFNWALASKKKDVMRRIYRRDTLWDKLVFGKIQAKLGGKVKCVITGSAPISEEVMTFLRCALGCYVIEGYGQTESGATCTMNFPGDSTTGNVGAPLPGSQLKLVDVPEMSYYAKNNIGEVCVKADYVFKGYFRDPEKTAEALDADGWLHTGDVGRWLDNGCLEIVDRKKNIFKLSHGEFIATEKIENIYMNSPLASQCFVDGDRLKNCLMGVVVPDEIYLEAWAPKNGYPKDINEFCKSKEAKDLILKDVQKYGKTNGLRGFEQVKDIHLEPELFSVDNELLTPTFKNMRCNLRHKYKDVIAQLYVNNGM